MKGGAGCNMYWSFRIKPRVAILFVCALGCVAAGSALLRPTSTLCTNAILAQASPQSDVTVESESEDKVAYLTFDDGPSKNTEPILDILKEYNVKATFFVCAAENNEKYLPLLARTVADGHQIGLHSCTHEYRKIYQSPEAYWEDIDALYEKIKPYVGARPTCIRFPGGSTNTVSHKYGGSSVMKELKAQATEKGYRYFDWNNCPGDAEGGNPSAETLLRRVMRDADGHNRTIVLMHDTATTGTTVSALPQIISELTAQGYRFDVVENYPSPVQPVTENDAGDSATTTQN